MHNALGQTLVPSSQLSRMGLRLSIEATKAKVSGKGTTDWCFFSYDSFHTGSGTHLDFGGGGGGENASILPLSLGNSKAKEADLLIPELVLLFCPEKPSVG